ncbi:hypothetical protein X975_20478, partial [Stegodyphus mimosarum]
MLNSFVKASAKTMPGESDFHARWSPSTRCCTGATDVTTKRVISRYFPTAWPPRSPDLTPCDFWLWGYLKSKVYQGVVQSLAMLKDNMSRTVREIPADMLLSAVVHTVHRMQYVVHNNRSHIEPHLNAK